MTVAKTLVLLLAMSPSFASAASAETPNSVEQAERLFREGRQEMARRAYPLACSKFEASYALDPTTGTLLNLANCEEHSGELLRALAHWRTAANALPARDPRLSTTREKLAALEARIPRLMIRPLTGAPADMHWTLDGKVSTTNEEWVLPGPHDIAVSAKGYLGTKVTVTLVAGERREVMVHAGPLVRPLSVAEGTDKESPPSSRRRMGIVVGALGLGALATASVTGLLAWTKHGEIEAHCDAMRVCDDVGTNAASLGRTLTTVSWIGLAAGVLGTGIGTYLFVSAKSRERRAWLLPILDPHQAGVALQGSFR